MKIHDVNLEAANANLMKDKRYGLHRHLARYSNLPNFPDPGPRLQEYALDASDEYLEARGLWWEQAETIARIAHHATQISCLILHWNSIRLQLKADNPRQKTITSMLKSLDSGLRQHRQYIDEALNDEVQDGKK